jgi:dTDP-4-dehydrorhamnose 3,5-epimerase
MAIKLESTSIPGLHLADRTGFSDARGSFHRLFCHEEMTLADGGPIAQVNYSITRGTGTVRGMHYQIPPHAEAKVVTCLHGEVFDVAVDLRADSPTFLHWYGTKLNGESLTSLVIPPGLAHGFQVLSDEAHLLYFHSQSYQPEAERRAHPLDPALKIAWPLEVLNLSLRDRDAAFLDAHYPGMATV